MTSIRSYLSIVYYLISVNMIVFFQKIKNKIVDLVIWVGISAIINIYVLPSFGLSHNYGAFNIVGMVASAGLFEQYNSTVLLINDFEGNNVTSYYLTLPFPSWMVFLGYTCYYALNALFLSLIVLPIGKLCFWYHLDLSHFNSIEFVCVLFVSACFFGVFTIVMASLVSSLEGVGSVWMRFIFPVWIFGGFQYSYALLKDINPLLAKINLCNPVLYMMEGTRAAVLGNQGFLNVWLCVGMIILFTVVFGAIGMTRMKRRLDFI